MFHINYVGTHSYYKLKEQMDLMNSQINSTTNVPILFHKRKHL
jgi:hypothetical protein